jgi:hypothetical protein
MMKMAGEETRSEFNVLLYQSTVVSVYFTWEKVRKEYEDMIWRAIRKRRVCSI